MWNTDSRLLKVPSRFAVNWLRGQGLRGVRWGGGLKKTSIVEIKPELSFSIVTELLNRIPWAVRRVTSFRIEKFMNVTSTRSLDLQTLHWAESLRSWQLLIRLINSSILFKKKTKVLLAHSSNCYWTVYWASCINSTIHTLFLRAS